VSIWPFRRKGSHSDVPTVAPFPADELRAAVLEQLAGRQVVFDGPFPITNDQGRFLCKGCGIPYDEFSLTTALGPLREALAAFDGGLQIFHFTCRKCGAVSVFSPKNVLTLQSNDTWGPWSKREIEVARMSLVHVLRFSPAEVAAIPAERLATVLNLHRK
jgi:hypothetical protein